MPATLTNQQKNDLLSRGFTRRHFGRIAAVLGGAATLPFATEPALAQLAGLKGTLPPDAVKINANENPMGPCPEAADAIYNVIKKGGRYMFEETPAFGRIMAESEGLKPEYALPFAGSSQPLHGAVLAFTSPARSFVVADPGYEAGERAAQFAGAPVVKVPLTKDYAHDVKAMAKVENAGLIYLCNPNNPTGTLTSREDIEWLLANKPAGSMLMVDEAYLHFSGARAATDLVPANKDIIVLRTFSKLYGMAGLRAGAALAHPDVLDKIGAYSAGALPVAGMVGANASLQVKNLVAARRKVFKDVREDVFAFLDKHNFTYVPSVSNKFMLDGKRPGKETIERMAAEKVYVGRVWPVWPTYVRVSIGTQEEMNKFKAAWLKVMA